jgi:hypothetical protein
MALLLVGDRDRHQLVFDLLCFLATIGTNSNFEPIGCRRRGACMGSVPSEGLHGCVDQFGTSAVDQFGTSE